MDARPIAFPVEAIAVGFGVACSTAWIFLLSSWLANAFGRASIPTETAR